MRREARTKLKPSEVALTSTAAGSNSGPRGRRKTAVETAHLLIARRTRHPKQFVAHEAAVRKANAGRPTCCAKTSQRQPPRQAQTLRCRLPALDMGPAESPHRIFRTRARAPPRWERGNGQSRAGCGQGDARRSGRAKRSPLRTMCLLWWRSAQKFARAGNIEEEIAHLDAGAGGCDGAQGPQAPIAGFTPDQESSWTSPRRTERTSDNRRPTLCWAGSPRTPGSPTRSRSSNEAILLVGVNEARQRDFLRLNPIPSSRTRIKLQAAAFHSPRYALSAHREKSRFPQFLHHGRRPLDHLAGPRFELMSECVGIH